MAQQSNTPRFLFALVLLTAVAAAFGSAAQSPATPQTKVDAPVSEQYQVGPGDSFDIVVANHPELSSISIGGNGTPYLVPDDGIVMFPEIGPVHVAGHTMTELTLLLTKKFNAVLFDAHITLIYRQRRTLQVPVLGDLVKPVPLPLAAGVRVSDAISTSGGLLPEVKAAEVQITVAHRDGSHVTFPMTGLLQGDPADNPVLKEGDSVFVDSGEFTVYVAGQVLKPGATVLKRGGGLIEALASAGGTTDTGAISRVQVTHVNGTQETVDLVPALLRGQVAGLPKVGTGDSIMVPQTNAQFAVLGHVTTPGVFPYPEGQTITLAQAIGYAKGDVRGKVSHITVSHSDSGKTVQKSYDFTKYLVKADKTQNPDIHPGDVVFVPGTNQLDNETAFSGIGALGIIFGALFHF